MKKIYCLTISLLAFFHSQAQWAPIHETTETNYYALYALDKERVFLGSEIAAVHRSSDGGTSFSLAELQDYGFVQSIAFENGQIGYAGGGCYFPFDQCPGNTFYRTEDGGITWDTLLSDMNIGVFTEIAALGNGNVFAISDYGGLSHSTNGGLGWQSVLVQGTTFPVFGHLQFLDAQRGFVSTHTVLSSNNVIERLHYTTDGGTNWATIFEQQNPPSSILDFHFTDAQHGVVAVPGGKLLLTDNGGTDWTEQIFGTPDEQVSDLFFVNENTAYMSTFKQAENQGRIYRSNNGGSSWAVDLELDSAFVGKLYFVDKENGWALTDFRKLYQRTGLDAVAEHTTPPAFGLFPNPAKEGFLLINPTKVPDQTLLLTDAWGRRLKSLPLLSGENKVPLTGCSNGLYFLQVVDRNGHVIWNGKVVKE